MDSKNNRLDQPLLQQSSSSQKSDLGSQLLLQKQSTSPIKTQQKQKKKRKPAFQVRDMKHTFISLEKAFEYIGDNSRYQKRIMTIIVFQWIFYSFFVMGMSLLFQAPKFECLTHGMFHQEYKPCSEKQVCDLIEGGLGHEQRVRQNDQGLLATEFDLKCDNHKYLRYAPSIFFIGYGISAFIMSFFADKYGRRKILFTCLFIGAISLLVIGFSPSIEVLMGIIFSSGFGMGGYETILYAYITEISGPRFRNFSSTIMFITWACAQLFYAPIEAQLPGWRIICFISGVPLTISIIFVYKFFVESPRYLVGKGRYKDAREVFRFISVFNLRPAFEFHLYEEMDIYNSRTSQIYQKVNKEQLQQQKLQEKNKKMEEQKEKERQQRSNYFAFCTNKKIGYTTINMMYCWFLRYFVYFTIQFNIAKMGNSTSISFFLLAISEVMAAIISIPLKLKMQRLPSFRLSMILITVGAFILIVVGKMPDQCKYDSILCWQEVTTLVIALVLKFSITFFAVILMTYTSEVYPTVLRSQGFGICMITGQMGSTLASLFKQRDFLIIPHVTPLGFLAILGSIGYLQTYMLPETDSSEIQDYIFDFQRALSFGISKKNKNSNKSQNKQQQSLHIDIEDHQQQTVCNSQLQQMQQIQQEEKVAYELQNLSKENTIAN